MANQIYDENVKIVVKDKDNKTISTKTGTVFLASPDKGTLVEDGRPVLKIDGEWTVFGETPQQEDYTPKTQSPFKSRIGILPFAKEVADNIPDELREGLLNELNKMFGGEIDQIRLKGIEELLVSGMATAFFVGKEIGSNDDRLQDATKSLRVTLATCEKLTKVLIEAGLAKCCHCGHVYKDMNDFKKRRVANGSGGRDEDLFVCFGCLPDYFESRERGEQ